MRSVTYRTRALDRAVAFLGGRLGAPPAHPRLLLDPARVDGLRSSLATTHRFLWDRYLEDLPRMLAVAKRETPLADVRYEGDLVPDLAFAWLVTGREDLLAAAKLPLLRLADDEAWGSNEDLVYLVPAHYILGLALGYDWLHSALSPDERARVAGRLAREAAAQHRRITVERAWWRNQYFQNHSHSNTAALAFAAAALWVTILGYDPTVPPADPSSFPTFARFPEIDQVMMRSSWTDPGATLVGFKCGPFMGRTLSKDAVFDYGTGHQDADSGSFQLFSHGEFLAIDPLYTGKERTEDHSTMLFKRHGQLGEQSAFGSMEALRFGHLPEIVHAETTARYDYVVSDVTRAYHPALGLTHASNGYVVGQEGEAFATFAGDPGSYRIAAVYLDNVPGAGRYSFQVDGRAVHSWTSRNEDRDDHLIAVSGAVPLARGSRVAFRAAPMSSGTRLTKLSIFSETVKAPLDAEWLLHLDPKAEVRATADGLEALQGGAVLELHRLLPQGATLTWGRHAVAKPEVEPFTFRETTRVVVRPSFSGNEAFLLTLLRGRGAADDALADVRGERGDGRLDIRYTRGGQPIAIDWDLSGRTVGLSP